MTFHGISMTKLGNYYDRFGNKYDELLITMTNLGKEV